MRTQLKSTISTIAMAIVALVAIPMLSACGGGSVGISDAGPMYVSHEIEPRDAQSQGKYAPNDRDSGATWTYRVIVPSDGYREEVRIAKTYAHVVLADEMEYFGAQAGTAKLYELYSNQWAERAGGRHKPFVLRVNNTLCRLTANEGGQTGIVQPIATVE